MDKIIFEKVGKRLKMARELNHITLEEAGKKVDVHKSTILRWENGETSKIKLPIIQTLASFYNVNPVWLIGYDAPMTPEINKERNTTDSNLKIKIQDEYGSKSLELLENYKKLNKVGKKKANENIKDLTRIKDYTIIKNETNESQEA